VHERDGQVQRDVAQDGAADRREHADEHGRYDRDAVGERLRRADRAEEPDRHRIEGDDQPVQPREEAEQQHAQQRGRGRHRDVPVVGDRGRQLVQQDVAHEAAAEAHDHADQRDAEQVDAALGEPGREHGALDGADRDGGEVEPERDGEERGGHGTSEPPAAPA